MSKSTHFSPVWMISTKGIFYKTIRKSFKVDRDNEKFALEPPHASGTFIAGQHSQGLEKVKSRITSIIL